MTVKTSTVQLRRSEPRSGLGGLILGAIAALLILLWVGSNGYKQTLVMSAVTYALIALGMYVPYLMAGSLSMAYSAYAGIGGYAVGLISTKTGLPMVVAWIIGPIVAAVLAVLLGLVTSRLSGFFLAAVTLLFGMAFTAFLIDAESITGGSAGLGNLRPLNLLGWTPTPYQMMVISVIIVCLIAFLLDRLRLSPWGVIVRTMRDAPRAVEAAGVRVPVMNLWRWRSARRSRPSAAPSSPTRPAASRPDTFTLNVVFLAIFMPLIGGSGTPWGAVAGAVIAVELTLNFPALGDQRHAVARLGSVGHPAGRAAWRDRLRGQAAHAAVGVAAEGAARWLSKTSCWSAVA